MTSPNASLEEGIRRHQAGDLAGAEALYRKVLDAAPETAAALVNLAGLLLGQGDVPAALALVDRALRVNGDNAAAHCIRGIVLFNLGHDPDAVREFEQALASAPDMAEAHNGLANVRRRQGRLEDAIAGYSRAIAANPGLADAYSNRGVASASLRRIPEALADYDAALARAPTHAGARWNRALALLLEGDYARGWPDYEERWRTVMRPHTRAFPAPQWRGEDIAGKTILIHAEQGLGDALQFCRYVPLVAARGARVVCEVHKPLRRLFGALAGVSLLMTSDEAKPPFDLHCPMLSLPGAFGTTLETVPAAAPYLAADPVLVEAWRARLGPRRRLRIGVVWAGRPDNQDHATRSMPVEMLAPVLDAGAEVHCLQKEVSAPDRAWAAPRGMIFHDHALADFAETAALAAQLDVVVSVCTATAHLAGALGLPVWVLLCFAADWRWLRDREDSPWYPTARLFRQPGPGDWPAVTARVAAALRGLA